MSEPFRWIGTYRLEGEHALKAGLVQEIEFSDATYQIGVLDPKSSEIYWTFFQFDDEGDLKDAFCSCPAENGGCEHLSAAYLKIFNNKQFPLHIRFYKSLWNQLSLLFAAHTGYDERFLAKKGEGHFVYDKDVYFEIKAKSAHAKKTIYSLIEERPKETPETSLKFSNLTHEEIAHWREGRPSEDVRYRLSFWSDLAKWMMFIQESGKPYTIHFTEDENGMPTLIEIDFQDFKISWHCKQNDLFTLIPALDTVNSPLKVFHQGDPTIKDIHYSPEEHAFTIKHKQHAFDSSLHEGKIIGDWTYFSGKGFEKTNGSILLKSRWVGEEEIVRCLDEHAEEIASFIPVQFIPTPLSYVLYFDTDWNWHFEAYLFDKGDLQKEGSAFFGRWAYIADKGFFRTKGQLFKEAVKILSSEQVTPFINEHKFWLNGKPGFQTHLASVESPLTYSLSPRGELIFETKNLSKESRDTKDFGEWIYYANQGFFAKKEIRTDTPVRPGIVISASGISSFIKANKEDLETIAGFFSQDLPISDRGLDLGVYANNAIHVNPVYTLHSKEMGPVQFFGDFVYQQGKGFHELPLQMRLPDFFEEEQIIPQEHLASFFTETYPLIKRSIRSQDPSLVIPVQKDFEIDYLVRLPNGKLKMEISLVTEHGKIKVADLIEAYGKKKRYFFSAAGLIDLHDEAIHWMRRLKEPAQQKTSTIEASVLDFLHLDASLNFRAPPEDSPTERVTKQLLQEMRTFVSHEAPPLTGLKSELRTYQKTGFQWLWFLYQNGLSGLLCDDMGLGKTHQAMALIASLLSRGKKELRFLVVCPTSVIYHWQDKLEAFLPGLKVHVFHGFKRTLETLPKEGLLLTSYGVLRVEKEKIGKIPFELAIFDEVQIAKNTRSRVHEALKHVQANMRLGLTGTPIENNLFELKALFDLVLPGYLPGESRFKELFVTPIEKAGDVEKKALLSQLIRPFVLRRRKKEVLQELPEKTIEKSYCDLSKEQAQLYMETLSYQRQKLLVELSDQTRPVPFVPIFVLLSQLKQICNHPALFLKEPQNYQKHASGKWDLFVELLDEARESEQKVVVFSQYLHMLDMIESHVKEKGWGYAQIRGATIDRKAELVRFQEDPECVVFLGSLQAAGLGIDLTAASVVFLYDRWWNAARENQAIDRVHRIGQKWGVQVFKLITKGTIEEKIDQMITEKGRLLEEIIGAEDENVLKSFTREELLEILSFHDTNTELT